MPYLLPAGLGTKKEETMYQVAGWKPDQMKETNTHRPYRVKVSGLTIWCKATIAAILFGSAGVFMVGASMARVAFVGVVQ